MSPPPFRSAALRTMLAIPRQRNRGAAAKRPWLVSMHPPAATTHRWHGAAGMAARCAAASASASSLSQDPTIRGFHRNHPAGASARLHRDRPRCSTLVAVTGQEDIPNWRSTFALSGSTCPGAVGLPPRTSQGRQIDAAALADGAAGLADLSGERRARVLLAHQIGAGKKWTPIIGQCDKCPPPPLVRQLHAALGHEPLPAYTASGVLRPRP